MLFRSYAKVGLLATAVVLGVALTGCGLAKPPVTQTPPPPPPTTAAPVVTVTPVTLSVPEDSTKFPSAQDKTSGQYVLAIAMFYKTMASTNQNGYADLSTAGVDTYDVDPNGVVESCDGKPLAGNASNQTTLLVQYCINLGGFYVTRTADGLSNAEVAAQTLIGFSYLTVEKYRYDLTVRNYRCVAGDLVNRIELANLLTAANLKAITSYLPVDANTVWYNKTRSGGSINDCWVNEN